MTSCSWTTSVFIKLLESKKPSKRAVQFFFTSRHTVQTLIPSSNYSPHSRRSSAELPHILSRMRHSPSGASARPSPRVSLKSLKLNALHTLRTQDMVHLNGNRSRAFFEKTESLDSPAGTNRIQGSCWSGGQHGWRNRIQRICVRASLGRDRMGLPSQKLRSNLA